MNKCRDNLTGQGVCEKGWSMQAAVRGKISPPLALFCWKWWCYTITEGWPIPEVNWASCLRQQSGKGLPPLPTYSPPVLLLPFLGLEKDIRMAWKRKCGKEGSVWQSSLPLSSPPTHSPKKEWKAETGISPGKRKLYLAHCLRHWEDLGWEDSLHNGSFLAWRLPSFVHYCFFSGSSYEIGASDDGRDSGKKAFVAGRRQKGTVGAAWCWLLICVTSNLGIPLCANVWWWVTVICPQE